MPTAQQYLNMLVAAFDTDEPIDGGDAVEFIGNLIERIRAEPPPDLRQAWHDWHRARRQLERLNAYKGRFTPGMKMDLRRWREMHAGAEKVLREAFR